MSDLRWAVLGTGRIAAAVTPKIAGSPGNLVVAVASREAARAAEFVAKLPADVGGGVRAIDQRELASARDVDAVYITHPHRFHAEWALRMLEAGKHVLVEKPLCATRAEAERLTDASRRTGRLCVEGMMYMHHPQTARLVELARPGSPIGPIRLIRSNRDVNQRDPYVLSSRMSHALQGGALMDLGCYPLSLALLVMDQRPEWATLRATAELGRWVGDVSGGAIEHRYSTNEHLAGWVDETCSFSFAFPSGARFEGSCSFSRGAPAGASVFFELIGERGRAHTTHPFSPDAERQVLRVEADGVTREEVFEHGGDKFINQFERFACATRGESTPLPTLEWSMIEAEAIERIHAAVGVRW